MRNLICFLFAAWAFLCAPAIAQAQEREGLSASDLFAAAAEAEASARTDDALTYYEALSQDSNIEVRTEARFRRGLLLVALGRYAQAAVLFRAILDEKPTATRVRLELARALALLGDEAGARRALRQAQATGLPPDVAVVVDQFTSALRSNKLVGGSFEVAFAPDTNINRATSARTLDTVIAPLTLSEDARAQSGIGAQGSAQVYVRVPLTSAISLLPRISGKATIYRKSLFDDVSSSALVGLEWRVGSDRFTPSIGRTWRWYGGSLYATTNTVEVTWLHALSRRAQLTASGSAADADYKSAPSQSGGLFDVSATAEIALSAHAGLGATTGATRQSARDPGYATTSGTLGLFGWRELGRSTLFASAVGRRTIGDERLLLFPNRRKDWLLQLSTGATLRWLTFRGFAPIVRATLEHNESTVGLYKYDRFTTEFGLTRAF